MTKLVQCFFLTLLLISINAKIIINVNVSDTGEVIINHTGIDIKVVENDEINAFGINGRNLYLALQKHYGTRPSNAYLKSPTPWGDLYKKYHYEQVSRVLTAKSVTLTRIDKRPVVVMSQDFQNFSNKTIKVNTGISQSVENSISTSWSRNNEMTVSQELEYDVNIIFAKVSGTTGFSFTSSWGETVEKTETISIGTTTSMETELTPGQSATAVLSANRGLLEVEVVYQSFLRGNVAVNFRKPINGHHFLGPYVQDVMKSGGLSNAKTTVEKIRVAIYMDASLNVYDKVTRQPL